LSSQTRGPLGRGAACCAAATVETTVAAAAPMTVRRLIKSPSLRSLSIEPPASRALSKQLTILDAQNISTFRLNCSGALYLSPLTAIGFTHLENRLKHKHLDEPRFRKLCGFGHRPIVEKTPLFHRGRQAVERCVHTIAACGERSPAGEGLTPSPGRRGSQSRRLRRGCGRRVFR